MIPDFDPGLPAGPIHSLDRKISRLRDSSSIKTGGLEFSVKLGDGGLPGVADPCDYLNRLGIDRLSGAVGVVCPGNCGLMEAARRLGAYRAVGFEYRYLYFRAVTEVVSLLNAIEVEESLRSVGTPTGWSYAYIPGPPSAAPVDGLFSTVIWAQGLEYSQDPATEIAAALDLMVDSGTLYLEAYHGDHGAPSDTTNSWRPSKSAFLTVLDGYDVEVSHIGPGLLVNRSVYSITKQATGGVTFSDEDFIVIDEADLIPESP